MKLYDEQKGTLSEDEREVYSDWHISGCMAHRCSLHKDVLQLNSSEISGAECGACVLADVKTSTTKLARLMATWETRHPDSSEEFCKGLRTAADMMCQWLRGEKPHELTERQIHLTDAEIVVAISRAELLETMDLREE